VEIARSGHPVIEQSAVADGVGVVTLDSKVALEAGQVGTKAANLATARRAGLHVLPGFVLTISGVSQLHNGQSDLLDELHQAWAELGGEGEPVIVRSSSIVEDTIQSSQAGQFASVLNVRNWAEFRAAVAEVLTSSHQDSEPAPMAVLVQPQLKAQLGGVLFGIDPVTGKSQLRASLVSGGPAALVAGTVNATELVLNRRGKVLAISGDRTTEYPPTLGRSLARLARQTAKLFHGPQDNEWVIDEGGKLWLLQSRPITTRPAAEKPIGPIFGAGPIAETFPHPLSALEQDLWVVPLQTGIRHALRIVGVTSKRRLARSPILTSVHGHIVADLELLSVRPAKHRLVHWLDPRPAFRRLVSAWRVGQLRAVLPQVANSVVLHTDNLLSGIPNLIELSDSELLSVLERGRGLLTTLHGYEVLTGLLIGVKNVTITTGIAQGLRALAAGRKQGQIDAEILANEPVVLCLFPPKIGAAPAFPSLPDELPTSSADAIRNNSRAAEWALLREALRIRVRWVQELMARTADTAITRLVKRKNTPDYQSALAVDLAQLTEAMRGQKVLPRTENQQPAENLPAAFQLSATGGIVPLVAQQGLHGHPAGGGHGSGPVLLLQHSNGNKPDFQKGRVLVTSTLDPSLAPLLPKLAGLIAETGSPLSHLAILAREYGIPAVVGVAAATSQLRDGQLVSVDGQTGVITSIAETPGSPKEAA
jgi:rifampicin phosphotransferase